MIHWCWWVKFNRRQLSTCVPFFLEVAQQSDLYVHVLRIVDIGSVFRDFHKMSFVEHMQVNFHC